MLSKAEFRGAVLALSGVMVVIYGLIWLLPGLPGELLLQSLRFHLAAVGLVLGFLAIAFGARWRGALFLVIVFASAVPGVLLVQELNARRVQSASAPSAQFRFLSFNVLAENEEAEALVDAVLADPPDVMLVMETPGIVDYFDRLATVLPYRIGCADDRCDISLHSRFPIENADVRLLPPFFRERLLRAEITIEGQPVTFVGLHLSKPYFDEASWGELYYIRRVLEGLTGPVVLAGDFNAAAWSDPVARLARDLDLAPGPVMPATWPVEFGWLGVPIDNVFTGGQARLLTLEAGENYGSNHRPLWANVAVYPN